MIDQPLPQPRTENTGAGVRTPAPKPAPALAEVIPLGPGTAQVPVTAPVVDAESVLRFEATLHGHGPLDVAATALASALAEEFDAERVSIGLLKGRRTALVATSDHTDLRLASRRLASIAAAMEEAVDQAATILYPAPAGSFPRITQAHARLIDQRLASAITVPLIHDRRVVGAITFEHGGDGLPPPEQVESRERLLCLLAPVLALKHQAEAPWWERLTRRAQARSPLQGWFRSHLPLVAGLLAVAVVAGTAWIPVSYRVSAPARVEGAVQRAIVAPADGFLHAAHVRPGDTVEEGQVLAELAGQELALERDRWAAEQAQHDNSARTALAKGDRTQYVVFQAKAQEALSRLRLAEEQLERSQVVAPFAGLVIQGDLTQTLGAPLKRGDVMLTMAPAGAFRLIVEVDEREIAYVTTGRHGALALAAAPVDVLDFEVIRIRPVATNRDGRNFFEVEGRFLQTPPALRPGLLGVAKIEAPDQPVAWIWGHRLLDWMQLAWWSIGG